MPVVFPTKNQWLTVAAPPEAAKHLCLRRCNASRVVSRCSSNKSHRDDTVKSHGIWINHRSTPFSTNQYGIFPYSPIFHGWNLRTGPGNHGQNESWVPSSTSSIYISYDILVTPQDKHTIIPPGGEKNTWHSWPWLVPSIHCHAPCSPPLSPGALEVAQSAWLSTGFPTTRSRPRPGSCLRPNEEKPWGIHHEVEWYEISWGLYNGV